MNGEILDLAYQLNEILKQDDVIQKVYKVEKIMMDNAEFQLLVVNFKTIENEYNDAIKHKVSALETQKRLYEVKKALDTLPVVINYREAYKQARQYLNELAHLTFANISDSLKINALLDY